MLNNKKLLTQPVGHIGQYRSIFLSKVIDPETEKRRCKLTKHSATVQGVTDYHTDIDIMSHLGTHLEAPCHHQGCTKDVADFPFDDYMGRGVKLHLKSCKPKALITRFDLEQADQNRVCPGDIIVLDSNFHSEPFVETPDDNRPQLSKESAEWFLEKKVRAVGFGDGIAIENNTEHCIACHDIMLGNDILFIEVMQNIDQLKQDVFAIVFMPLPIIGLDSSPVSVVAIEGIEI